MIRNIITVIILIICLQACKQEVNYPKESIEKTEYSAYVTVSAGDTYPQFDTYQMPTFFNVGHIKVSDTKSINTLIIGPKRNKKKVDVVPIATFSIRKDSTDMDYVLSYLPGFSEKKMTYELFMVKHSDIVSGIESWFRAQCEMGQCGDIQWSNTYKTLLQLENSNLKN